MILLKANQRRLDVTYDDTSNTGGCELIEKCHEQYQQEVVILVDEYDKLILDNFDQIEMAKEAREILEDLYTIIKDSNESISSALISIPT